VTPMAGATEQAGWWSRLAHSVIRRPWLYLLGVLLILAVLAAPVTRIQFGGADIRIMPASSESRIVADRIAADFPSDDNGRIDVYAPPASTRPAPRRCSPE